MGCEALSIEYYESLNQKAKVTVSPPFLTKPIGFDKYLYGMNTLHKKKRIKAVSRAAISGLRYYNLAQGKWLSRDPIGERGWLNIYGFVGNNGVNACDYLGMADDCCDPWFDCIEGCYKIIEQMERILAQLDALRYLSIIEAGLIAGVITPYGTGVAYTAINDMISQLKAEIKADGEQMYSDCLDGCNSSWPECGFN